jgi:hypothetical protein
MHHWFSTSLLRVYQLLIWLHAIGGVLQSTTDPFCVYDQPKYIIASLMTDVFLQMVLLHLLLLLSG